MWKYHDLPKPSNWKSPKITANYFFKYLFFNILNKTIRYSKMSIYYIISQRNYFTNTLNTNSKLNINKIYSKYLLFSRNFKNKSKWTREMRISVECLRLSPSVCNILSTFGTSPAKNVWTLWFWSLDCCCCCWFYSFVSLVYIFRATYTIHLDRPTDAVSEPYRVQ